MTKIPFVSIIIPCRNEEKFIEKCINSIIANDYPKNKLEVLIVDGRSEDKTRNIVKKYLVKYRFLKILDNPSKIASSALNIGIRKSRGKIIMRMDAHCIYEKDYISKCVKYLEKFDADCVGGLWITLPSNDSVLSWSIALSLSSPFGVGDSYFRIGSKKRRYVDTVPFGCYRREVFDRIGFFDEELVRNQDDEFNFRLLKNKGRILLCPDIVSYYYARDTLNKLWRMYFQYGYFKPLVLKKIGKIFTLRQIIPPFFISLLMLMFFLSIVSKYFLYFFFIIIGTYLLVNCFFSVIISFKSKNLRLLPFLIVSFLILHFSYGTGYLKGIIDFLILRKKIKAKDIKLTR